MEILQAETVNELHHRHKLISKDESVLFFTVVKLGKELIIMSFSCPRHRQDINISNLLLFFCPTTPFSSFAHLSICLLKAKNPEKNQVCGFGFDSSFLYVM